MTDSMTKWKKSRFNGFGPPDRKPLKRLGRIPFAGRHRAEATVLMKCQKLICAPENCYSHSPLDLWLGKVLTVGD